ncbi:CapA family protein [Anaerococcus marasmi]|uniref:CapA family protein n=1 Tax=Anaerococcus marasmi TaxID=2057797 RepID=UPI000CF9DCE7|nr:CapA family protein [Anaerococcus marasmi]
MKKKLRIFSLVFLIITSLVACNMAESSKGEALNKKDFERRVKKDDVRNNRYPEIDAYIEKNKKKKEEEREETKTASLLFGGDIIPHMPINDYALNYGGGVHDYSRSFEDIKDFAEDFDFFMLNNEFSVNDEYEVSGYPSFNSNENIYKAMKNAGVDLVTTANNHCLDTGVDGVTSTIEAIKKHDLDYVGTSESSYRPYVIKEVNGIRIGILSYTEILNGNDYLLDTKEKYNMVNTLSPKQVKTDIEKLKKKKVDLIVVYPHWGEEYSSYPREDQIELAHDMVDWGADLVIGNHPHVIQPKEVYETKDGKIGLIYYSLGNLLSNQKAEAFEEDYRVEQGLLVECNIEKKPGDKARITSFKSHTTIVDRSYDEYGYLDKTYVATRYLEDEDMMKTLDYGSQELIRLGNEMNLDTLYREIEE